MARTRMALALVLVAVCALAAEVHPAVGQVDQRPNIVLIVTDDQRWDTVRGVMTVVESELIGRGIEFENAFTTDPLCCPSRASILTGQYPHTHGVYGNTNGPSGGFEAFDDSSTIATWLDDAGYRTGLIGRHLNGYEVTGGSYIPPGWDRWFAFIDKGYVDYEISDDGQVRLGGPAYSTDMLASEAANFIWQTPAADPLFLMFTPLAPHGPSIPASRHEGVFADLPPYRPTSYSEANVQDKPRWVQAIEPAGRFLERRRDEERTQQLETLLAVDEAVGRILDALEAADRLENTLIVFTSDNGYQWGEHRLWGKNYPYDASIRVPLIMRYDAGIAAGSTTSTVVANIDLAPTIAAVAGVSPPSLVDGLSLTRFFSNPDAAIGREGVLIEHARGGKVPPYCGFRTEADLFVRYSTGEEEYYTYGKDPLELQNRVSLPSAQSTVDHRRDATRLRCSPLPPDMSWR